MEAARALPAARGMSRIARPHPGAVGQVVMQRTAKPLFCVRFRPRPLVRIAQPFSSTMK
jgi:hypothetical protein